MPLLLLVLAQSLRAVLSQGTASQFFRVYANTHTLAITTLASERLNSTHSVCTMDFRVLFVIAAARFHCCCSLCALLTLPQTGGKISLFNEPPRVDCSMEMWMFEWREVALVNHTRWTQTLVNIAAVVTNHRLLLLSNFLSFTTRFPLFLFPSLSIYNVTDKLGK